MPTYLERMQEANTLAHEVRETLIATGDRSDATLEHFRRTEDIIGATEAIVGVGLLAECGLPLADGVSYTDPDHADTVPWSGDINELLAYEEAERANRDPTGDGPLQMMREVGLPVRDIEDMEEEAPADDYLDDFDDEDEPESASSLTSGKKQRKKPSSAREITDGTTADEDEQDTHSISEGTTILNAGGQFVLVPAPSKRDAVRALREVGLPTRRASQAATPSQPQHYEDGTPIPGWLAGARS